MSILEIVQKIKHCEDEAEAQLLIEGLVADKLRNERNKLWCEINKYIKDGDLGGNGTDKNAERNGMVLASNIIFSFGIYRDRTPHH